MMNSDFEPSRRVRGGFTLVELLVVIGIIVLLFSIATPIVITARRNAARVRMQADLNTISMGLEQYKKDFREYPRPDPANPSFPVLAWALVGPWQADKVGNNPGDGADGPGFRLQWTPGSGGASGVGGRVWGPYVPPDKFPVEIVDQAPTSFAYLLDSYGSRIEYFPKWHNFKPGPTPDAPGTPFFGVAGTGDPLVSDVTNGTGVGIYDCRQATAKEVVYYLQRALGDGMIRPGATASDPPTYPHNDVIDKGPEHALTTDYPPFILFSRGYQGKSFSPKDEVDKDFTKVPEVSTLPQP